MHPRRGCVRAGALRVSQHHPLPSEKRTTKMNFLRILVYLVMHDSGSVCLEHLLPSQQPSQSGHSKVSGFRTWLACVFLLRLQAATGEPRL